MHVGESSPPRSTVVEEEGGLCDIDTSVHYASDEGNDLLLATLFELNSYFVEPERLRNVQYRKKFVNLTRDEL